MSSLRDDEDRRLGFDQHQADVERWAAIDRVIEMTPAVSERPGLPSCCAGRSLTADFPSASEHAPPTVLPPRVTFDRGQIRVEAQLPNAPVEPCNNEGER